MVENSTQPERKLTPEDRLLKHLPFAERFDQLDQRITQWMARYGLVMMRVALGIIFFWFGALKLIPGPVSYTHLDVYKRQLPAWVL